MGTFYEDKKNIINYAMAFIFILLMVYTSVFFNDKEIILPEIAAMAVALWVYRSPEWLQKPENIFILPSVTALIGFSINMLEIPYLAKIVLVLIAMAIIMLLMKSIFPPALATGFLPIVTNAYEWSFIISIVVTSFVLMLGVLIFKLNKGISRHSEFDNKKLFFYIIITLLWAAVTYLFNIEQLAVIPPITVVVYESLKMKMYSLKMALKQTAALTLSITLAVLLYNLIANWILLSLIYILVMYLLLKLFNMKIPAVYAFPFLVFVFPPEIVQHLPIASLVVSFFSFGLVLLIRKSTYY